MNDNRTLAKKLNLKSAEYAAKPLTLSKEDWDMSMALQEALKNNLVSRGLDEKLASGASYLPVLEGEAKSGEPKYKTELTIPLANEGGKIDDKNLHAAWELRDEFAAQGNGGKVRTFDVQSKESSKSKTLTLTFSAMTQDDLLNGINGVLGENKVKPLQL